MTDLTGKVALITGGDRRAGKVFTLALAKAGADIAVNYWKSEADAVETKKEVEALGRKCLMREVSIADIEGMKNFVDEIDKTFGRLDILVHNASNFNHAPFQEVTEEHWDGSMDIILKGPFFLSQAASKLMMKNGGGRMIALIGNSSYEIWPDRIPHTIAKCGMLRLMENLAVTLSPHIQCNCVCPGPFFKGRPGYEKRYDEKFVNMSGHIVRNGDVDSVAELVLFLASCTEYINGAVIPIDGGKRLIHWSMAVNQPDSEVDQPK